MSNKLFALLTIIPLLFIGLFFGKPVYADGDNVAPVITNVSYEKSLTTPDTLTITYTIEEEGVGATGISFEFVKYDNGDLRTIDIGDDSFSSNPRYSGTYTVSATIPETQAGGKYYLVYATCVDQNNNAGHLDLTSHWCYGGNGTDDSKVNGGDTSLEIIDPPGHDSTAPLITNVSYEKSLATPNTLTITYTIEEEGDGATDISFEFVKFNNGDLRTIDVGDSFTSRKSGTYTITADIPTSQAAGTYYLVYATCVDKNHNAGHMDLTSHWSYGGNGYDDNKVNGGDTSLKIVAPAGHDDIAPVITNVKYAKNLTTPDTLNIQYTITEDGIGATGVSFEFVKFDNGDLRTIDLGDSFAPRKSGIYNISLRVPTSQAAGTYYLVYATCVDKNDNAGHMDLTSHWCYGGNGTDDSKVNDGDTSLVVNDEFNPEFETFITNTNLHTMLANMNDNGVALVGYNKSNGIAKKELFETIAGTNKTIVFQDNGFQWIVNGADIIDECKDIDLRITTFSDDAENYGAETNNVIVFKFADNGTLPGTMTVRAKVRYLLGKNAKLYYYNNNEFALENDDGFGFYDGQEPWCEIEVSHNSTFLLSNKALVRKTSISKASVSGIASKTYTGKSVTQKPVVKLNGKTLKAGTDYKLKYKNNKNIGEATCTITGKGKYVGAINKKFKIVPKGTSISKIVSGKKSFKTTWKKQTKQTTGYQIQYSTNKNFKTGNKTVTIKKNKTISKKVTKLKTKKKYYVRIRTYKTVKGKPFYSAWSKVKVVTTKI